MQLNPYNFRQYLAKPGFSPEKLAWALFAVIFVFLVIGAIPYMAPAAVSLNLPHGTGIDLRHPPSAFVVCAGNGFVFQNRFYDSPAQLFAALSLLEKRDTLMIAAASTTTLQDLLPLLNKIGTLHFRAVAFTVKP